MTALSPTPDTSVASTPAAFARQRRHPSDGRPAVERRRAHPDLQLLLDAVEATAPACGIDALAAELTAAVGATRVSFLIADISGGSLVRLAGTQRTAAPDGRASDRVPISQSHAGNCLREQKPRWHAAAGGGVWFHAPVSERGEAIGVLELLLPHAPEHNVVTHLAATAHALAYIVIADRRYTDLYENGMRSTTLTLEAEIQRQLLPSSFTCEAEQFTLAGWLVLANQAGGDTFDYTLDQDTLHLSITDAMGHGVDAALLATLAVGTLRNSRRRGATLVEQACEVNTALVMHAEPDQFVTGQLMRIELATGTGHIVNAGHMNPLLVRDGQVTEVALTADLVFGVSPDTRYHPQSIRLEAGDRLVLITDGMFESTAAAADVAALLGELTDLHPRETVQALTHAVLSATAGAVLDDATVLVLDWRDDATS